MVSYRKKSQGRTAFTLVELLVVITIIGVLAALITAAAIRALTTARQAAIKVELNELAAGFDKYKDKAGSFPPNALTNFNPEPITNQIKTQVYTDFKRHFQQAFPNSLEPDEVLQKIVDWNGTGPAAVPKLEGGMNAEEAVVFWLGGFSADPKYPLSGPGGPSYNPADATTLNNNDPIDSRGSRFVYPFDMTRLGPRDSATGLFDGRFITYTNPKVPGQTRRINFWKYVPARSEVPYVYFDTSRYTPDKPGADPPARPALGSDSGLHVHALKRITNPGDAPANWRIVFANPDKYQVLHCGLDGRWGDELDKASYAQYQSNPADFLTFPTGPFTADLADTVVNFVTQSQLADAQTN